MKPRLQAQLLQLPVTGNHESRRPTHEGAASRQSQPPPFSVTASGGVLLNVVRAQDCRTNPRRDWLVFSETRTPANSSPVMAARFSRQGAQRAAHGLACLDEQSEQSPHLQYSTYICWVYMQGSCCRHISIHGRRQHQHQVPVRAHRCF